MFSSSFELQRELDLEPLDSIVLASVLRDTSARSTEEESIFISRDRKAFAKSRVIERLLASGCRAIPTIGDGLAFVQARL